MLLFLQNNQDTTPEGLLARQLTAGVEQVSRGSGRFERPSPARLQPLAKAQAAKTSPMNWAHALLADPTRQ